MSNNGIYNTQNSRKTATFESRGVRTTKGGINLYIELEKHKLVQVAARNIKMSLDKHIVISE